MRRFFRGLIVAVSVLFAITLFLLVTKMPVMKQRIAGMIEDGIQKNYALTIKIVSLDYDLMPLTLRAGAIHVFQSNRSGKTFLRTGAVEARFPYSNFWHDEVEITRLNIDNPSIEMRNWPHAKWKELAAQKINIGSLNLRSGFFKHANLPFRNLSIKGSAQTNKVVLTHLSGNFEDALISASGELVNFSAPHYSAKIRVEAPATMINRYAYRLPPFLGRIQITGLVNGDPNGYLASGDLLSEDLSVTNEPEFRLSGKYRIEAKQNVPVYHVALNWNALPLSVLNHVISRAPPLHGHSDGMLFYTGKSSLWSGKATLRTHAKGSLPNITNFEANLNAALEAGKIDGDLFARTPLIGESAAHFHVTPEALNASALIPAFSTAAKINYERASRTFEIDGTLNEAAVRNFRKCFTQVPKGLSGTVTANFHITGRSDEWRNAQGGLTVRNASLAYRSFPFRIATGSALGLKNRTVLMKCKVQANEASLVLSGSVPLNRNQPVNVKVSADAEMSLLRFLNDQITGVGDASLNLQITGTRAAPGFQGDLSAPDFALTYLPNGFTIQHASAIARLTGRELQLETKAYAAGLNFHGSGVADLTTGKLNFTAQNQTSLSKMTSGLPQIKAAGELSSVIRINGTLTSPQFSGNVAVEDGAVQTSAFPISIENIQMQAALEKDKLRLQTLSARAGGGSVQGSGTIQLALTRPSALNVALNVSHVGIQYPRDVRSNIGANLRLSGSPQNPLLSGDINIAGAEVQRMVDPPLRTINSFAALRHRMESHDSKRGALDLELTVKNSAPIQINNNLGRLQASCDLQIQGNNLKPIINGRIVVQKGGELYLQTRVFKVARGNINFHGNGVLPSLDLLLTSFIQDDDTKKQYEVMLPISGPIDNLQEVLPSSDPPLLPQQVQFLLLTGRTEAQLSRSAARFMSQQLISYYSAQIVLPVPEYIARDFSLSRVEIHPELISAEKEPGSRIVTGKDYFSGVSLIYSESLGQSSEQTWIADYKWKKNLSFRFIDQEDGTYSSSLRQSIRLGKTTAGSAPSAVPKPFLIRSLRIENQSPVSEAQIIEIVKVKSGDPFDFWKFQEKISDLQKVLQSQGYLWPSVKLITTTSNRTVDCILSINARGKRQLHFNGVTPTDAGMEKFKDWWRTAAIEDSAVAMMEQELLQALWLQGFQNAVIHHTVTRKAEGIIYTFTAEPGPKFATRVLFTGLAPDQEKELRADLKMIYQSDSQLSTDALHDFAGLKTKIEALLARKGYLQSRIGAGPVRTNGQQMEINIAVEPRSISRVMAIVASKGQHFPNDLQAQLKLRPGSIYDPAFAAEDELNISNYYESRGYHKIKLHSELSKQSDGNGLIIHYDLNTGGLSRIASIQISGNRLTKNSLIQKQIGFRQGDVLSQDRIAIAQKNLSDLRVFDDVKIDARETARPDSYDVTVNLTEKKNYEIAYGLGFNSEKGIEGRAQISDLNLFGNAHAASLIGKVNREDRVYRFVYHSPALSGLRWKTLVSASYEQIEQPLLFTKTIGVQLQRQNRIVDGVVLIGNYTLERVQVTEKDPSDTFYTGETPVRLSRLSATVLNDTRNDPVNPHSGRFLSVQFSGAPAFLGSQISFLKAYGQFEHYRSFGKVVWASGLRLGLANAFGNDLIATERFFAGGSYSLRGFERDQLGPHDLLSGRSIGGEALFIINQELRFPLPIHEWVKGAIFYDGGNVYRSVDDLERFRIRHSAGVGLRFETPVGIGRFDWGINLFPQAGEKRFVFHIALGQAF